MGSQVHTFVQRSLVALMSGAALLAACSGSTTPPPPPPPPQCAVTGVTVTPAPGTIELGATVPLTATIAQTNCTGLVVAWSTSNALIADVSQAGVVTGTGAGGPVTISAAVGGKTGTVTVTVTLAAVATITLAAPFPNLTVGATSPVTATLKDVRGAVLTGRVITWGTSDGALLSVTQAGVVQGVALGGPVNVTAISEGKNASLPLSVVTRYGYVFADQPTIAGPYDGNTLASFSTVGSPNSITRTGTGNYTVLFRNMGVGPLSQPMVALANAIGAGNSTCAPVSTADVGSDLSVIVNCNAVGGTPVDLRFNLTVWGKDAFPGRFGFVLNSTPTVPGPFNAPAASSFNASGQPIVITRTAAGAYDVQFTGNARTVGSAPAETFLVASNGAGGNRCEIVGWSFLMATVSVRCALVGGGAVDQAFALVMLEAGRPGVRHALVWSNCGAASCTPSATYSRSTGGAIAVTHTSTGNYDVTFTGLARTSGTDNVVVTSYGSTGGFCKLLTTVNVGADLTVSVQCFSPGASVGDRLFDVAVIP